MSSYYPVYEFDRSEWDKMVGHAIDGTACRSVFLFLWLRFMGVSLGVSGHAEDGTVRILFLWLV